MSAVCCGEPGWASSRLCKKGAAGVAVWMYCFIGTSGLGMYKTGLNNYQFYSLGFLDMGTFSLPQNTVLKA